MFVQQRNARIQLLHEDGLHFILGIGKWGRKCAESVRFSWISIIKHLMNRQQGEFLHYFLFSERSHRLDLGHVRSPFVEAPFIDKLNMRESYQKNVFFRPLKYKTIVLKSFFLLSSCVGDEFRPMVRRDHFASRHFVHYQTIPLQLPTIHPYDNRILYLIYKITCCFKWKSPFLEELCPRKGRPG